MRRARAAIAAGAAAVIGAVGLGVVGAGAQDDFQPDRVRLLAIFRTLDLGEKAFLSGQFRHLDHPDADTEPIADTKVILEESFHPYTEWTAVADTLTDQEGYYSFSRQPNANMRYRVRSENPPVVSKEPIVRVRADVKLAVNRTRVREGSSVVFTGTVTPPHDRQTVLLQQLNSKTGKFRTVKRIRLRGAPPAANSSFRLRMKMRREGVHEYRARFTGDADHLPGMTDRNVKLTVVEKPERRRRSRR